MKKWHSWNSWKNPGLIWATVSWCLIEDNKPFNKVVDVGNIIFDILNICLILSTTVWPKLDNNTDDEVVCESAVKRRHWNKGLVSSRASLTSWGEGAFLVLVGNPSSDGVTIKMAYGVDVLQWPSSHPSFPIRLVLTKPTQ